MSLKEGQDVEAGTVIVQLNPSIAQANADKAKDLRDALEQELKQARAAAPLAEKKYASLKDVPSIPDLQKEEARLGVEDAKSKVIAAEKRFQAAEKEARAAADQLQFYTLKTPLKGRLDRVLVSPGQTIAVGTVVAEVTNVDNEVDVLCFVSLHVQRQLMKALADKLGESRLGGITETTPDKRRSGPKGRLVMIADRADPDTGNFAVKVRFSNSGPPSEKLRPNTALRVRILTGSSTTRSADEPVLSIPESALLEDTDPPNVVIVETEVKKNKEGKEETVVTARRLQATIGLRSRITGMVEIRGLKDPENTWQGDLKETLFVTTKNQGLQTGDLLKQEEDEPEAGP